MARHEFLTFITAVRRAVARSFGVSDVVRRDVLTPMLEKPHEDRPLYWFELSLSMGIATFGLVLNSAGVVIGAMLIAPLMTPILELAMGLVIMSAYLLIRALLRVLLSVVVVVLGAAFITLVLPFHEPTPELLARTAPTALDLFVAIFCALAAAVTTTRPHSGATSTAAGTAIGIALVPPLCAAGFGAGSGRAAIAEGAMLLFTANLCAILVFASVFFWLVGFVPVAEGSTAGRVPEGRMDARKLALARVIEQRLSGSYGGYLRALVPVALLASVFMPLQRALAEVSWEVTTRSAVSRLVGEEPLLADGLQVNSLIERGSVRLDAVVVGTDEEAEALERRLAVQLASASGVTPLVRVRAVPQASLFSRPSASETRTRDPSELISPRQAADKMLLEVTGALRRHWPGAAGPLLSLRVEVGEEPRMAVAFVHLGEPLGSTASAILAAAISNDVGSRVEVRSTSLPAQPLVADVRNHETWLDGVSEPIRLAREVPGVHLCLGLPPDALARRNTAAGRARSTVLGWTADIAGDRVAIRDAGEWSLRFATGRCDPAEDVSEP